MGNEKVKRIDPPFGYFGSKNRIAVQICKKLPPHNCWVEAFCGSASLTLCKKPAPIEVINDIDYEIINLFEQLRNNHSELTRLVRLTPYSEYELVNARQKKSRINKLERARRFLVQSMMSVNGIFGKERGGFSYSDSYSRNGRDPRVNRWSNLPERIEAVVDRLRSVRLENKDAREVIRRYLKRPATLIYLDPPYFAPRTNGYKKDRFDINFHVDLMDLANRAKCMLFISGYENDLYNEFLTEDDGWKKETIRTYTKDPRGRIHKRSEVLWLNSHFQKARKEGKIPIELTEKEQRQKKLNPERGV